MYLTAHEPGPDLRIVTRYVKTGFHDEQARVIAATVPGSGGPLRVIGAYFPNGQEPGSDKFAYKMRWLDALREWVRAELAAHPALVLMGDFNVAPEDRDVHDPVAWARRIHCTDEERAAPRRRGRSRCRRASAAEGQSTSAPASARWGPCITTTSTATTPA